jgi:hypothetical protein
MFLSIIYCLTAPVWISAFGVCISSFRVRAIEGERMANCKGNALFLVVPVQKYVFQHGHA